MRDNAFLLTLAFLIISVPLCNGDQAADKLFLAGIQACQELRALCGEINCNCLSQDVVCMRRVSKDAGVVMTNHSPSSAMAHLAIAWINLTNEEEAWLKNAVNFSSACTT